MSKGMRTCTVCGRDFFLLAEDHYITIEGEKLGLSAIVGEVQDIHDAMDCPHCGCQQILCKRERRWLTVDCELEDREEEDNE